MCGLYYVCGVVWGLMCEWLCVGCIVCVGCVGVDVWEGLCKGCSVCMCCDCRSWVWCVELGRNVDVGEDVSVVRVGVDVGVNVGFVSVSEGWF